MLSSLLSLVPKLHWVVPMEMEENCALEWDRPSWLASGKSEPASYPLQLEAWKHSESFYFRSNNLHAQCLLVFLLSFQSWPSVQGFLLTLPVCLGSSHGVNLKHIGSSWEREKETRVLSLGTETSRNPSLNIMYLCPSYSRHVFSSPILFCVSGNNNSIYCMLTVFPGTILYALYTWPFNLQNKSARELFLFYRWQNRYSEN